MDINSSYYRLATWGMTDRQKEKTMALALREDAEFIEQDGVPGLRVGSSEQYAEDTVQAWILRLLLKEKRVPVDKVQEGMVRKIMPEIEREFAKAPFDWMDDGRPGRVGNIKWQLAQDGMDADRALAGMLLGIFILDFTDFLAKEETAL